MEWILVGVAAAELLLIVLVHMGMYKRAGFKAFFYAFSFVSWSVCVYIVLFKQVNPFCALLPIGLNLVSIFSLKSKVAQSVERNGRAKEPLSWRKTLLWTLIIGLFAFHSLYFIFRIYLQRDIDFWYFKLSMGPALVAMALLCIFTLVIYIIVVPVAWLRGKKKIVRKWTRRHTKIPRLEASVAFVILMPVCILMYAPEYLHVKDYDIDGSYSILHPHPEDSVWYMEEYYADGGIRYQGGYKRYATESGRSSSHTNEREGLGIHYFLDGYRYEGNWEKGLKVGWGTILGLDGSSGVGCWAANKKEGRFVYYHPNGVYVKELYKEGKFVKQVGQGQMDAPVYVGCFLDDTHTGTGRFYYVGGGYYEGHFTNGLFDGEGILYDAGGMVLRKGNWKEERPEDLEDHYCLAGKNVRKQQVK